VPHRAEAGSLPVRTPRLKQGRVRETKGYNESFNPARDWMLVKSDV